MKPVGSEEKHTITLSVGLERALVDYTAAPASDKKFLYKILQERRRGQADHVLFHESICEITLLRMRPVLLRVFRGALPFMIRNEARALVARLDDLLDTPLVDRVAALDEGGHGP